jgi:hypothetical protein
MSDKQMEVAITRALEQQPKVAVPADFAARVRNSLPPQPRRRAERPVGRTVAMIGGLVTLAAMFAVAPHVAPNFTSVAFDLELVLLAELGGIAWWFGTRDRGIGDKG